MSAAAAVLLLAPCLLSGLPPARWHPNGVENISVTRLSPSNITGLINMNSEQITHQPCTMHHHPAAQQQRLLLQLAC
jgi:hypothetical protein